MPIRAEGLSQQEVIQRLTDHIKGLGRGGQKRCAQEFGVSESYLCDVLKGRCRINEAIFESLGLKETIVFERVE